MEEPLNIKLFHHLSTLLPEGSKLQMTILKHGDKITVSIIPTYPQIKDDALSRIVPLVITGTKEELDQEFVSVIATPLQKSNVLASSVESFEKSLDEAKKNSEMEKKKKDEKDKKQKEDKEKLDKTYKEAKDLFDKESFKDADEKIKSFFRKHEDLKESPDAKKLNDLAKTISEKVSTPNLFD